MQSKSQNVRLHANQTESSSANANDVSAIEQCLQKISDGLNRLDEIEDELHLLHEPFPSKEPILDCPWTEDELEVFEHDVVQFPELSTFGLTAKSASESREIKKDVASYDNMSSKTRVVSKHDKSYSSDLSASDPKFRDGLIEHGTGGARDLTTKNEASPGSAHSAFAQRFKKIKQNSDTRKMSRYSPKIHKHIIKAILTAQQAHSCAFRAEIVSESSPEEPFLQDYATADGVDDDSITKTGADTLFAFGSGMKLMINFALYRMMEDGKTVIEDDNIRAMMRGAWDKPAFRLYNELRDHRGLPQWRQPQRPTPSVVQLMTHLYGFPAHQRGLFGPDGSFLMSEETFGQTFAALVDSPLHVQVGKFCYSNWNTMLLGFIIKYATGQSLADALKVIVLDYCKMSNTVLDRETFEQKKDKIARPNVSTAASGSLESSILCFLDDAALAVGGGFSCVEDMTNLLKSMLKPAMNGDDRMKEKLFYSTDTINDEGISKSSFPSGMYAPLDSEATGSESFERIPGSNIYKLGRWSGESVKAVSKAGAVRGYACHFYMIPFRELVIAVMTNTSGIADPSQMVAQYLIQEIVRLDPPLDAFKYKASEIYTRNRDILKSEATCHRPHQGFSSKEREKLQGCYVEAITRQRIVIQISDHNQLSAYIEEGCGRQPRRTSEMKLIKIAKDIVAFSPLPRDLAVDAYDAWRNFGLEIKTRNNGEVCALAKAAELPVLGQSANRNSTFNERYERRDI